MKVQKYDFYYFLRRSTSRRQRASERNTKNSDECEDEVVGFGTKNETALDVRSPAPFRLKDLPDVPLMQILKYIAVFSLKEMRQTSRWVNDFIVLNRNQLAGDVEYMMIKRRIDDDNKKTYDLDIATSYRQIVQRVPNCIKATGNDVLQMSPSSTVLFVRLAKIFARCRIRKLELYRFSIDEIDLDEVEQALVKSKLKIECIELNRTLIGADPSNIIRFLTILSPSEVHLTQTRNLENFRRLLSMEQFFTFMTTLRKLLIGGLDPEIIQLPASVHNIPEQFQTFGTFVVPLSTVVNAIREWYEGEGKFGSWCISLRKDVSSSARHLAEALELPYEIALHQEPSLHLPKPWEKVVIRNCGGKNVNFYRTDVPANETAPDFIIWSIEDDF